MTSDIKCIVIGAGKSVWENKYLDMISKSNFKGYIATTDRMIMECLITGITPKKFKMFTGSQDVIRTEKHLNNFKQFYEIPEEYAKDITAWVACVVDPQLVDFIFERKFNVETYHRFGKVCAFKPNNDLHIKTGGNTGVSMWAIARYVYNCDKIATIGIDLKDSPYDDDYTNFTHWNLELEKSKELLADEFFSTGFKTFNCTKYGRFYGKGIVDYDLETFLNDN